MKQTITIEVPKGKKAVWDEIAQQVIFEETSDFDKVKSFEDACEILDLEPEKVLLCCVDEQDRAMRKLKIIVKALNGEGFDSLKIGDSYTPTFQFTAAVLGYHKFPTAKFTHHVRIDGSTYVLTSGDAHRALSSSYKIFGCEFPPFICKTKEIAEYISKNFPDLVFLSYYGFIDNMEIIPLEHKRK